MAIGEYGVYAAAPPVDDMAVAARNGIRPIDRKHLARYTLGDATLEEEVLGLFLSQLPMMIAALRGAASDKDWKVAAHTLKGSSRCVGAWRLALSGEQAEQLGGISNRGACIEAVLRIEDAAEEARVYILGLSDGGQRPGS